MTLGAEHRAAIHQAARVAGGIFVGVLLIVQRQGCWFRRSQCGMPSTPPSLWQLSQRISVGQATTVFCVGTFTAGIHGDPARPTGTGRGRWGCCR